MQGLARPPKYLQHPATLPILGGGARGEFQNCCWQIEGIHNHRILHHPHLNTLTSKYWGSLNPKPLDRKSKLPNKTKGDYLELVWFF